ncbi:hypothetical protein CGK49_21895, partial [Vibrio parahaemolyticus]
MVNGTYRLDTKAKHIRFEFITRNYKNRFGYDVEVFDENGNINNIIAVPDDTGEILYLNLSEINALEPELKDILENYFLYILPR